MYKYEEFKIEVVKMVQEHFAESGSVKVIEVKKNNGIVLDGLTITKKGEHVAPTIYLDGYYQQYQQGEMQLPEVVQDIIRLYEENHLPDFIDGKTFTNFNNVRDCICFKLINMERNSSLLIGIPYVPVLDLAMVFYVLVNHSERGQMTALITLEHLGYWKVRVEELMAVAVINTQRLLPAQIKTMQEVMLDIVRESSGVDNAAELVGELFSDDDALPMYVMTNSTGINGAACIAYEYALKEFAEMMESDLIILPSSCHEVLLLLDDGVSAYEDLVEMVVHINDTEVPETDVLSGNIYFFRRKINQLDILNHGK